MYNLHRAFLVTLLHLGNPFPSRTCPWQTV